MADYLILLEQGAWARPRPITVPSDDGRILTADIEPLEPAEVIHHGWQLDCVVDAVIEAFTISDVGRDAPPRAVCEALEDGLCADALAILLRVANLPGVSALRRRTEEREHRFLMSLGFSSSEVRERARPAPSFLDVSEAFANLAPANDFGVCRDAT
ncbi:hypothetical protein LVJ94_17370 [Pendulispora rubella]|uniref:Uncharacterized protein n=1 Tax=Pendulispora rubella TaxID=2741070 RepID=A0ABZ2LDX8_9BACT